MDAIKRVLGMVFTAIQQAITGNDNQTIDVVRAGLVVAATTAIAYAGYDLIALKHKFDMLAFGGGMSALFAGAGAGIGLKSKDENGA